MIMLKIYGILETAFMFPTSKVASLLPRNYLIQESSDERYVRAQGLPRFAFFSS